MPQAAERETREQETREQETREFGWKTVVFWMQAHPWLEALCIAGIAACGFGFADAAFERGMPVFNGWAISWPFNGIAIACLLLLKRRRWPGVIAGFFLAFAWMEWKRQEPAAEIAVDTIGNLTEILIAAFALPPVRTLKQWLLEPRLVVRFVAIAVLAGPALAALAPSAYFSSHYPVSFGSIMMLWGASNALGTVLWIPLILIVFSRMTYDALRWAALPETLGLLGGFYAVSWWTFHQQSYPLAFLPYPLLLLIALRRGFSGAVIGANLLTLIALSASLNHLGPLRASSGVWTDNQTIVLQLFCALAMLLVFPFSIAMVGRQQATEELLSAYAEMKKLATIDQLTQVANRRHFDEVLESEWTRAVRAKTPLALLMIDADYFKAYNDNYGHVAGDECLRRIAAVLSSKAERRQDLVARYGGEEFAVLMPGMQPDYLAAFAEALRASVEAAALPHTGNPCRHVTISVGCYSAVPQLDGQPASLIEAADRALYAAKQGGRNCVQMANEGALEILRPSSENVPRDL